MFRRRRLTDKSDSDGQSPVQPVPARSTQPFSLDSRPRVATFRLMRFVQNALAAVNVGFAAVYEPQPDTLGGSPAGNLRFLAHVVRSCRVVGRSTGTATSYSPVDDPLGHRPWQQRRHVAGARREEGRRVSRGRADGRRAGPTSRKSRRAPLAPGRDRRLLRRLGGAPTGTVGPRKTRRCGSC